MKQIPLNKNLFALVDDDDYIHLSTYRWHVFHPYNTAYAVRKGRKGESHTVRMHRQILGVLPGIDVDHINRDGLDNRKCNLRICSASLNQANMISKAPNKTSHYKGVSFKREYRKWVAQIQYRKKKYHLGYFMTEREAAAAYDKKAKELFKEFARLNLQAPVREVVA